LLGLNGLASIGADFKIYDAGIVLRQGRKSYYSLTLEELYGTVHPADLPSISLDFLGLDQKLAIWQEIPPITVKFGGIAFFDGHEVMGSPT
jgi:hypothetical protein